MKTQLGLLSAIVLLPPCALLMAQPKGPAGPPRPVCRLARKRGPTAVRFP